MAIPNPNPNIADGVKSDNKTYSSNKIESLIKTSTIIDDSTSSYDSVYSSNKVDTLLSGKQNILSVTTEIISNAKPYIRAKKYGSVVVLEVNTQGSAITGEQNIGTLPSGYRPGSGTVIRSYAGSGAYAAVTDQSNAIIANNLPAWTALSITFIAES